MATETIPNDGAEGSSSVCEFEPPPPSLPHSRLVSLLGIAVAFAKVSDQSIRSAIDAVYDKFPSDTYLYLAAPTDGLALPLHDPLWKNDRFGSPYKATRFALSNLLSEATRTPMPAVITVWAEPYGEVDAVDLLVERQAGLKLAQNMWDWFFPGTPFEQQRVLDLAVQFWKSTEHRYFVEPDSGNHPEPCEPTVRSAATTKSLITYIARQQIPLATASRLLFEYNNGTQYKEWWDALADAADSQQIQSGSWEVERSEQPLLHDDIRAWCGAHGYVWPVPLPGARKPDAPVDDSEMRDALDRAQARIAELEHERAELLKKIATNTATVEATTINSPTLQRIIDAVSAYPAWRAEWKSKTPPNLSNVEDWQKEMQVGARGGARLAHVAHIVIDEHFNLKA